MKKTFVSAGVTAAAVGAAIAGLAPAPASSLEAFAVLKSPVPTTRYLRLVGASPRQAVPDHGLNPLHEPGRAPGLRACTGTATSSTSPRARASKTRGLPIEFTNKLKPEGPPIPAIRSRAATSCSGSSPAAPRR